MSYPKGILLSLVTTAAAVVPSMLYHGGSLALAFGFSFAVTLIAVFVVWANAWRYRWEPEIRVRWFYVNLTSPAVLVLTIQAIGWRVFFEPDRTPAIPMLPISAAHGIACLAAILSLAAWIGFSLFMKGKEPNRPLAPSGRDAS